MPTILHTTSGAVLTDAPADSADLLTFAWDTLARHGLRQLGAYSDDPAVMVCRPAADLAGTLAGRDLLLTCAALYSGGRLCAVIEILPTRGADMNAARGRAVMWRHDLHASRDQLERVAWAYSMTPAV